jgi:hypothetical protein
MEMNVGLPELLAIIVVLVVAAESWQVRHEGACLVLKEFRIEEKPANGEFIYILGRRSGILAWFLTLFGLQSQTSFSITRDEVVRETVGPWGFDSHYAPMAAVRTSLCGYSRAFGVLVLSMAFYAYGLLSFLVAVTKSNDYVRQSALHDASTTLWTCLVCGTLCYVWYALSKRIVLSVSALGNTKLGISFKRSVIENVGVELGRAMEAVDLINAKLLAKAEKEGL